MSRKQTPGSISPERIEAYKAYEAQRIPRQRRFADQLGAWNVCARPSCRRSRSCLGPTPVLCARHVVQDCLSEAERVTFQLALRLRSAGVPGHAVWAEATRLYEERVKAMDDGA